MDIDRNLQKVSKGIVHIEENIIPTVNEKLGDDIDELKDRFTRIENAPHMKLAEEQKEECSIVIRNLEERLEEKISERVNKLIWHGLRLNGISIESAERKTSHSDSEPGIVLVRFTSQEDKKAVMDQKVKFKEFANI